MALSVNFKLCLRQNLAFADEVSILTNDILTTNQNVGRLKDRAEKVGVTNLI